MKFKKIKKCPKGVSKPDILHPRSSKSMKENYPNTSVTDGQINKNVVFCSCDDVIKPNRTKLHPFVPLCQCFCVEKIFSNRFTYSRVIVFKMLSSPTDKLYKRHRLSNAFKIKNNNLCPKNYSKNLPSRKSPPLTWWPGSATVRSGTT